MEPYLVPAEDCRVEEVIERSRFITSIGCAGDLETARAFIERVRREFRDASHNCHAFLIGPPGRTAQVGMSDAGEPHGTAGRPMLSSLVHSGVSDVVAVVTRYFGGVKLGKGGLSRAYSGCVKNALQQARTKLKVDWCSFVVHGDYNQVEELRRLYLLHGVELSDEEFGEKVIQRIRVREDLKDEFAAALVEAFFGQVRLSPDGDRA